MVSSGQQDSLLMHSCGMSEDKPVACKGPPRVGKGVEGNVRKREEKNRECDNSAGKIYWLPVSVSQQPNKITATRIMRARTQMVNRYRLPHGNV